MPPNRPAGECWTVINVGGAASIGSVTGYAIWPSSGETISPNAVNVRDFLNVDSIGMYFSLGNGTWRAVNLPLKSDHVSQRATLDWGFYRQIQALNGINASANVAANGNSFTTNIYTIPGAAPGIISANAAHAILSSTLGVVAISGALKLNSYTSATLPAGSTTMSGTMVWLSDLKTFAGYGPTGWNRILTASL